MSTSEAWFAGYRAGLAASEKLPEAYAERFAEQDDRIGALQDAIEAAITEIDAGKPADARAALSATVEGA